MSIQRQLCTVICNFFVFLFCLAPILYAEQNHKPSVNSSLDKVQLQLKWKHQFQFAGYYAALEKGYYKDVGLDVKIVEIKEGEEAIDLVVEGQADFGVAMSDLVVKRAHGVPVVALAAIYQHSPLILLSPYYSRIEHVHDLLGKRIALENHSEELLAYFNSEHVSIHKMILHPHDFSIENLINKNVDAISAYSTDEPFLLLKENISYSIFSPRAVGIDFYGDTLFTSEDQITNHPERVEAFLDASLKGWRYALNNSEEIIDLILAKYSRRHSRAHLEFEAVQSKKLIIPEVIELGYMNRGRWQHIANTLKSLHQIPQDFSLEGFLYSRDEKLTNKWVYLSLVGTILFSILIVLITARFFQLNRYLKNEILIRKKTEENLRSSERKLSTLMSNLPGMAYRCYNDEHFTMLFVSMGCKDLTGYSSEELINNKSVNFSSLIHEDDRDNIFTDVESAVNDCRPFKLNYRIVDKSGNIKWVWEQGRSIYSPAGEFLFLEGFITDVSNQKSIELEREELIETLQRTLDKVNILSGLLPLCSHCKKVRDDKGYWNQIDEYITTNSDADISHSICPDCAEQYYADYNLYDSNDSKKR